MARKILFFLALTILVSACASCPQTCEKGVCSSFKKGQLETEADCSLSEAYHAHLKAIKNLNYTLDSKIKDQKVAYIEAITPENNKVVIGLQKMDEAKTAVQIRYGLAGDETASLQIFNEMQKYL